MKDLKIFAKTIEPQAQAQIDLLLAQKPFEDCKVRIMPDVHAGAGCVIGFTANLGDKVIPNIVGVDIGCGMLTVNLGPIEIDYDCACGAGATLIAAVNQIEKQLFEAKSPLRWQNHVLVTAQDLDFTTGMMCYIQLSLLGCAGYIKIGNTLTDPMHDGDDPTAYWYTPGYFSSVWQLRRIFRSMDRLFKEAG